MSSASFDHARSRRLDTIVLALEAAEDAVLRAAWRRCKAWLEEEIPNEAIIQSRPAPAHRYEAGSVSGTRDHSTRS